MAVGTLDARAEAREAARDRLERLAARPATPCVAFLILLSAVLSVTTHTFLTAANLITIVDDVAIVGVIAIGVNQVVLSGEIDISVGAVTAMSAFLAAETSLRTGGFIIPLVVAVGFGACIGTLNGLFVTVGRLPSIIVTLGMLYAVRGLELHYDQVGVPVVPNATQTLGSSVLHMKIAVLILAGTFLALAWSTRHTKWGRDVIAIGGNRSAAVLAGLNVDRVRLWAFVLAGVCSGVAAMIYIGQQGSVQPQAETGLELQVIAAVVVGGTSITGGRGSSLAPLAGAVLLGVIYDALILFGIAGTWQNFFTGALMLLAVSADVVRRRLFGRAR